MRAVPQLSCHIGTKYKVAQQRLAPLTLCLFSKVPASKRHQLILTVTRRRTTLYLVGKARFERAITLIQSQAGHRFPFPKNHAVDFILRMISAGVMFEDVN